MTPDAGQVFGIALLLLAGVLAWRVWVSHTGSPISRFSLLALALLVGICAILCFVVDTRNVANQSAKKKVRFSTFSLQTLLSFSPCLFCVSHPILHLTHLLIIPIRVIFLYHRLLSTSQINILPRTVVLVIFHSSKDLNQFLMPIFCCTM